MTLYYEDVPADDNDTPQLPPLLTAVAVPANQDVHAKAIAACRYHQREHLRSIMSYNVLIADIGDCHQISGNLSICLCLRRLRFSNNYWCARVRATTYRQG